MGALDAEPATGAIGDDGFESAGSPAFVDSTSTPLALLEVVDRDGQTRQQVVVRRWPVTLGRALDNDLVLGDAYVAAHHARIDLDPTAGLVLEVGATRNGVAVGARHVAPGVRRPLVASGDMPIELTLGRTLLRLRLPGQAVADELPLESTLGYRRRVLPVVGAGAIVVGGLLFTTWLGSDPDSFVRSAGMALLSGAAGAAVWCGIWALLSKTFGRQARFGWHLRVFLYASVAMLVVSTLPKLLAFSMSWPWLSSYDFIGEIAVVAGLFYFHLLAVEPQRRRLLKAAAFVCALVGVLLAFWFNEQRTDRLGDELYMSHLFPPALRIARPVPVERLIGGLDGLKDKLDRKAREPGDGHDDGGDSNDDP